jgi:hypothetical protein
VQKQKGTSQVLRHDSEKKLANNGKKQWKKPSLEDVSGQVMAQPYIRFT